MTTRLAIDARQIDTPGIGRYVRNLLTKLDAPYKTFVIRNPSQDIPSQYTTIEAQAPPISVREQIELPKILNRYDVNILHSPNFNIPVFADVRQVTTIHDCAYSLFPEEMDDRSYVIKKAYEVGFRYAVHHSDQIIAVSTNTKQTLCTLFNIEPDRVAVTHLGAEVPETSGDLPEVLRNQEFILYVGSDRPRKNLSRLVKAYALFSHKREQVPALALAGSQDGRFVDIQSLTRQLDIEDDVVQLGYVSEPTLDRLYQEATFLAFPSLYEGFGLPALESMARGTPVITSPLSSLPEVVGDAGLYADPYDHTDIAAQMEKLCSDKSLQQTLSGRCEKQAKRFSWDDCLSKTETVYGNHIHR